MQHYDVAVLGGGPGSGVASILLARAGYRVAWVEHDEPSEPVLDPLFFAGEGSLTARLHEALGLTQPLTRRTPIAAGWHFLLPQRRIAVHGGRAALMAELEHEWPQDRTALQDLLQRLALWDRALCDVLAQAPCLPPETLSQRWALWRLQRRHRALHRPATPEALATLFGDLSADHPVRQLLLGPQRLYSQRPLSACSLGVVVHRMAQMFLGVPLEHKDRSALCRDLTAAAQRAHVTVMAGVRAERLLGTSKAAQELQLRGAEKPLRATHYLYGGRAPLESLSDHAVDQAHCRAQAQATQAGWQRWQFMVPTATLSAAHPPWTCLLGVAETGARGHAEDPLMVRREALTDETTQLTIYRPITAQGAPVGNAEWQKEVAPRLQRLMPFAPMGQAVGDRVVQPYGCESDRGLWGVGGPSRRTRFRNVFECGPRAMPGLGLEGEYAAAVGAVRLVTRRPGML